jgi:hypothetical protein
MLLLLLPLLLLLLGCSQLLQLYFFKPLHMLHP